jgi:hypothetical protein
MTGCKWFRLGFVEGQTMLASRWGLDVLTRAQPLTWPKSLLCTLCLTEEATGHPCPTSYASKAQVHARGMVGEINSLISHT